ncbi:helix-turn-helix domain-containing protein [Streptomyces sp. NPDC096136]|uniref:helix-turn-helix domain-containing protein n=1 Tax=Streptomyces sp. NPDC096136 TaxID=3366076 RepID=UPI00382281D8
MTPDVDTGSGSERGLPPPKERRRLRESGELTHEQVATELGVTAGTVRSWEAGRTEPGARTRDAYAELLARLARAGAGTGRSTSPNTRPGRASKRAAKPPSTPHRPAAPHPTPAHPAPLRAAAAPEPVPPKPTGPPPTAPPDACAPDPVPPRIRPEPPSPPLTPPATPAAGRATTRGTAPAAAPNAAPNAAPGPSAPNARPEPSAPNARPEPSAPDAGSEHSAPGAAPPAAAPPAPPQPPAAAQPPGPGPGAAPEPAAPEPAVPAPARPARPTRPAEAFDSLYAYSAPALVRQVYLLTGRRALAQESVERAFRQAWAQWPEVATDPDPVGWVRAAAYEYALSPWRRLRRAHRTLGRPDKAPADPNDRILLGALLALPPAHRRTVLLYDGVGLDLPDTAAETEASTPTTGNRLLRAHADLAARLPGLAGVPAQEQSAVLRAWLGAVRPAVPLEPSPAATVRTLSEHRARRWARAALVLTAVIAVATGYTTVTAPDHYEAPVAPGTSVSGVPPLAGPPRLTDTGRALQDKLRAEPAAGPHRLHPTLE